MGWFDEIVRAYDSRFHTLEAARKEYMTAVEEMISSLDKGRDETIDGSIEVSHKLETGDSSGKDRYVSTYSVGNLEICKCIARMATPWVGNRQNSTSKLQFIVGYVPHTTDIISNYNARAEKLLKADGGNDYSADEKIRHIYCEEIELPPSDMESTIIEENYVKAFEFSKKVAKRLCEEFLGDYPKVRQALMECAADLERNPVSGQKNISGSDELEEDWEDTRFMQVDFEGGPNIWIFFSFSDKAVYYAYDKNPALAKDFAREMNCEEKPYRYDGSPAGLLFDAKTLKGVSVEDIRRRANDVIKKFAKIRKKKTAK